ncbi:MAG TPA: hypothetical protein PKL97_00745 [Candidatus Omnitrophota bacterium]|nr:hypothetical protein [Candidatus Omnitrophota bacterium]
MKKILLLLSLSCLTAGPLFAETVTSLRLRNTPKPVSVSAEETLDCLTYWELQISAVTTDMYLYGWMLGEKERMRTASILACADLKEMKDRVKNLQVPKELKKLKETHLKIIDMLRNIYTGIERKKPEDIAKGFKIFNLWYAQYANELDQAWERYGRKVDLPPNFDPAGEEDMLFDNAEDRAVYLEAKDLIRNKKYKKAFAKLSSLPSKYAGEAAGDCIRLRQSDCLLMSDSNIPKEESAATKEGLSFLSKIMDRNGYSPVLYEAFYKWRTISQENQYGMTQFSEIPNGIYNKKRWQIIQTIKNHLGKNPRDRWAEAQINLLLDLPNISRKGEHGNDNMIHWGLLYTDVPKKDMGESIVIPGQYDSDVNPLAPDFYALNSSVIDVYDLFEEESYRRNHNRN